ncbi:hypothetical protein KKA13_04525 [Patescibacteria group bacterium]|nr:hypothetical protein [Patescibacteria group bacterium]MBU1613249.1 hypothetical protein [Patescibacteria group bacterium]
MRTVWIDGEEVRWGEIRGNPGTKGIEVGEFVTPEERVEVLNRRGKYRCRQPFATLVPMVSDEMLIRQAGIPVAYYLAENVSYLEVTNVPVDSWGESHVEHHLMPQMPGRTKDRVLVKWEPKATDLKMEIYGLAGAVLLGTGWVKRSDCAGQVLALLHPGQGLVARYTSRVSRKAEYSSIVYMGKGEFKINSEQTVPVCSFLMGMKAFSVVGDHVSEGISCRSSPLGIEVGRYIDPSSTIQIGIDTENLLDSGVLIPIANGDLVRTEDGRLMLAERVGFLESLKFEGENTPTVVNYITADNATGPSCDRALVLWTVVADGDAVELLTVAGGHMIGYGYRKNETCEILAVLHPGQGIRALFSPKEDRSLTRMLTLRYEGYGEFHWMSDAVSAGRQIGAYLI